MNSSTDLPPRPPLLDDIDRPEPPRLVAPETGYFGRSLKIFTGIFSLIVFSAIVWYAYSQGKLVGGEESAPIISAEKSPVRVRPENPGGLQVPYQDKLIFQKQNQAFDAQSKSVENLLPRPEEPHPTAVKQDSPDKNQDLNNVTAPQLKSSNLEMPDQTRNNGKPKELIASNIKTPNNPKPESNTDRKNNPSGAVKDFSVRNEQLLSRLLPSKNNKRKKLADGKSLQKSSQVNFRIQIASFRKESSARLSWKRLQKLYNSLLGPLVLTIEKTVIKGKGVFYRTQGGPLTEKQARKICKKLLKLKQGCLVVSPQ